MIKNRIVLLALVIFFIFRLFLVIQNLKWFQDTANDQIFAVKIANDLKNGQLLVKEGTLNSGLLLRYPPYYWYTLGIIRSVHNSYNSTLAINIIFSLVLFAAIYKMTALLSSKNAGVIALLIAMVSRVLLKRSTVVYSAYFPVPFAFFSLYVLLRELLKEKPNKLSVLVTLIFMSFLTTISYAATFQIALSIILILFYVRSVRQKLLYIFTIVGSFITFNFTYIEHLSISGFIHTNFDNLLSPSIQVYRPGIYENLVQQFYGNTSMVVPGLILIGILFFAYIQSASLKDKKAKAVLILFCYWLVSTILISKFGQFYKGILQYPILYVVLACLLDKNSQEDSRNKITRLVVNAATIYVFVIIPALGLPRFRSISNSHYSLIRRYGENLVAKEKSPTLFLVPMYSDNQVVLWPSQSIWYFDYRIHPDYYELFPETFCQAEIEKVCFRIIPDKIVLICPSKIPTTDIFDPVKDPDCIKVTERIRSVIGTTDEYVEIAGNYEIKVDKEKYKNLRTSIFD